VGVLDIVCATVLLWLGSRIDYIIAAIFVAMALVYRFEVQLGRVALYDVVNVMACVQFVVMGSGGFGELFRNLRSSIRNMRSPYFSNSVGSRDDASGSPHGDMAGDQERGISE